MIKMIGTIFIFLTYVAIILPVAIILKLINKDLLKLRMDEKSSSYWEQRTQESQEVKRLEKQY